MRAELATKIAWLMPGLSREEKTHIIALTLKTLDRLSRDAAVTVRAILAEEIKSLTCVPPDIIKRLAQDAESMVAIPMSVMVYAASPLSKYIFISANSLKT